MTFRDSISNVPDWPPNPFSHSWQPKYNTSATLGHELAHNYSGMHGEFDLARTSPPLSPKGDSGWYNPSPTTGKHQQLPGSLHKSEGFQTFPRQRGNLASPQGSLNSIISTLEDAILSFPSVMLLPDAHCIPAIRSHLYHSSIGTGQNLTTMSSYSNQVDWRPERVNDENKRYQDGKETNLHRSISLSTLSTFKTISPSQSEHGTNIQALRYELSPLPHFSVTNGDRSLHAIFPNSTSFLRAAIYSHVLAYTFITILTSPRPNRQSSNVTSIHTTTSHALPSKVVKVLGAPPMTARPARVDIKDGYAVFAEGRCGVDMDRIELLLGRTKDCIGWLLSELENPDPSNISQEREVTVNELVLRALVEVVKGCEQNVSVYV